MADKYDVVIVGGGIIGLCSAYYLRAAGARVLIVDRGRYQEAASTGNAGMVVPSHAVPLSAPGVIAKGIQWLMKPESPFFIKPTTDRHVLRWLWLFQKNCTEEHLKHAMPILRDLGSRSQELLTQICSRAGFEEVGFQHNGLLALHRSPQSRRDNHEMADRVQAIGIQAERLEREATLDLEPGIRTEITGSVYFRSDSSVDPERLMRALEGHLKESGDDFAILDDSVTRLSCDSQASRQIVRAQTQTGRREIEADHCILAAGAWTPELVAQFDFQLPVQAAKGYSLTVPMLPPRLRIPLISTDDRVTVTPLPGALRITGTLALEGFDSSIRASRVAPLQFQAQQYCRDVDGIEPWYGFRPASPDGLPYLGLIPTTQNVYAATGHGMMGVTLAPVTGQLIADLIQGRSLGLDISPLRLDRHA